MEFAKKTAPFIRKPVTIEKMMIDVLIALIPVTVFAIFRFGFDAIIRIIISLIVMIGSELVYHLIINKWKFNNYNINNITAPAISGLVFALLLPSQISIYVVIIGALFRVIVGKLLFGGLGSNIFNPAAVGRIFVAIAFPTFLTMGAYPGVDVITGSTPLGALSVLGIKDISYSYSILDLFFGTIPGSMGEISAICILIGAIYLVIRKSADFRIMLSVVGSALVLFLVAGLSLNGFNNLALNYTLYQVLAGGLLFGAVFMATDPVTSPITKQGRVLYGVLMGALVVLIRLFGGYPEGMAFAILFLNVFVPLIDYHKWSSSKWNLWVNVGLGVFMITLSLVVYFYV